ncbi:hypothetical protein [Devosia sp. RR2S18]|uniref:hypothetical protein n=1 Tax=Devosia rhizosphaerae TaxID=3049774 RepID=UPI002541BFF9|nr:hypothetical protein [Devosia sp. RR2S18]WIJ24029.1 hypothetical protein QOV41_13485 [Devosia sp. RR2S18]
MRKFDLKKLTAALAATAIVATSVTPTLSYDVDPSMFLNMVQQQAAQGDVSNAQVLVKRLQDMGVRFIVVGNNRLSLEQLNAMLLDTTGGSTIVLRDLAIAARSGDVGFGVGNRIITAIGSETLDNFPTSSAG